MTIRWGILGTGRIARTFTEDLLLAGHKVTAVGSRAPHTATAFAERYGIDAAYGSYGDLAADGRVDVVYVATPHSAHVAAARTCLEAGRAVLVEKPFATSQEDARALAGLARERGLFAMEAMWTRFNPLVVRTRELVTDGAIGQVQAVYSDFSIAAEFDPAHRLWAPELAGGALLDLGVYPVSFASMLLGTPDTVHAAGAIAPTGVDANTGILLGYASGAVALLHCGLLADSPQATTVVGTTGRIELATPSFRPSAMTLHRTGAEPETYPADLPGNGYTYQADEVARCLAAGLTESPGMPLDETVAIAGVLDTIAARILGGGRTAAGPRTDATRPRPHGDDRRRRDERPAAAGPSAAPGAPPPP